MSPKNTSNLNIVVAGASGRMGQSLIRLINETDGVRLSGALDRSGSPMIGQDASELAGIKQSGILISDNISETLKLADCLLDFTTPEATLNHLEWSAQAGIVHVIGTTGFSTEQEAEIIPFTDKAIIIKSGNMSLGVNLLSGLVKKAAEALAAEDFDIEIVEMHHKHKVDAPSGTALLLGEAAAAGRNIDLESNSERGRDGITGARQTGAIGFASLRGGSVVGEHSVIFAGEGERITLTHQADDRNIFSRGALKAARWGYGKKPGLYSMLDVLGLND